MEMCKNCNYGDHGKDGSGQMICRKNPPVIVAPASNGQAFGVWPIVAPHDWCGSFHRVD